MITESNERKTVLLTIRLTEEEGVILDHLCESFGKSISDTVERAYRFYLSVGNAGPIGERTDDRKRLKSRVIHTRISESDRDQLTSNGGSVSEVIRKAIRAYGNSLGQYF